MNTRQKVYSTILVLCIFLPVAVAQESPVGEPADLKTLLEEANTLATVTFDNGGALKKYQEAEKIDPNNYDMMWGTSRCYIDIGEHLPGKTDEERQAQLDMYQKALDYANRAVTAHPTLAQGYLRRAIANGRVALFKGVWESLDLVKSVKADTEKAIELDPADPTAHYILGRTHAKVSEKPGIVRWPLGLSWASFEESVQHYEQAISLRPDFVMYRLDAARAYVELDEYDKARKHLQAIPAIPDNDEDDPKFRMEAKELAAQIATE